MKFNNHNSKVIIGHEMKTDLNKFCNSFIHASLHSFAGWGLSMRLNNSSKLLMEMHITHFSHHR